MQFNVTFAGTGTFASGRIGKVACRLQFSCPLSSQLGLKRDTEAAEDGQLQLAARVRARMSCIVLLFIMVALFSSCGFFHSFVLSFFFFSSPNLSRRRLDACHTSTHGVTQDLECRTEMYCTRLAGNAGCKKITKKSPSGHHRTNLSGYIFATKARIDKRKKNS